MKIKEYRTSFIEELTPLYGPEEAESFFYLILEHQHQLKRIDLALQPDLTLENHKIDLWKVLLEQLKQEVPIHYLLGTTSFYGLEFEVNSHVLIPRPETEELIAWILSDLQKTPSTNPLKILDIGTGSGCIAIALAKNIPNAQVFAIDVSEDALVTARKNAESNAVKVVFLRKNILETEDLGQEFDIIVSNPPYVRNLEKIEIRKNVLAYEPHLALFVEDKDPLIFYRKIAELAQKNGAQNGRLYFEINQYLGAEMLELLKSLSFKNLELRKDIYSNDRMLKATL